MSAPTRQRKPLGVRRTLSDLAFVFELRPCANRGENSGRFTNDIGGGGARGLAHIGVIQWLTENGYDIRHGIFDIAFASMEAMQNTIARLKLAAYSPDVTVEIPRNACGFHEFWRAKELIALGRERTAQAFAATGH